MAKLRAGNFQEFDLSPEEEISGRIFNEFQLMVLHNLLAVRLTEKVTTELDVAMPASYIQNEAYMRGHIDCLNMLITSSSEAMKQSMAQTEAQPQDS